MCNPGGLTNHDTVYVFSDDKGKTSVYLSNTLSSAAYEHPTGRTWKNSAGSSVASSGSNPFNVNTGGLIVDSLNADHGLMNQESQDVDSAGQLHAIISYVPGKRIALVICLLRLNNTAHNFQVVLVNVLLTMKLTAQIMVARSTCIALRMERGQR